MNKPYTFAQRLKMLIDQRGISRSELARICGISKSNVTRYINGEYEAKQDVVYRMASSLGVSEAWLMGHDVPMERTPAPAPAAREIDPIYDALNQDGQKELCRYGRYLTAQDEYRRVEAQPQIVRIRHYLVPAASVRARMATACRHAGLPVVSAHDLRRSFASLAFHLGWPEHLIMEMGGWSNPQTVHRIYLKLARTDVRAAVTSMRNYYAAASKASAESAVPAKSQ